MEDLQPIEHVLGSKEDIEWCSRHPWDWYAYHIKNTGLGSRRYFITFTKNEEVTQEKWKKRIEFELSRKFVSSFKAVVEHEDTNIHVHALVNTNKYLKKSRDFKTFVNHYGFVDLKLVKHDHGITQYLTKDLDEGVQPATNPTEIFQ